MHGFKDLIAPWDPNSFLEDVWNKRFLHLRGPKERVANWFTLNDFAKSVFKKEFGHADLLLACDGNFSAKHLKHWWHSKDSWTDSPDLENLIEACAQEATVVYNKINAGSPQLRRFCGQLFQELGEHVSINAYFSPPNALIGLGPHYDPQEIFILQIFGSKEWFLSPASEIFPVSKVDFSKERFMPELEQAQLTLEAGDVLYLPRGTWHRPRANDKPSLHLTITITPRTAMDFTNWIQQELVKIESCRRDLPLVTSWLGDNQFQDFSSEIEEIKTHINKILEQDDLAKKFFMHGFLKTSIKS